MRLLTGIAVLLMLIGCAREDQPEVSQRDQCIAAYRAYDSALRSTPPEFGGVLRGQSVLRNAAGDFRFSAETRLRQFGCLTFPGSLNGIDPDRPEIAAMRNGTSGPLREPVYMHLGIVTTDGLAVAQTRLFASFGYPVRNGAAPGLGRRLYIGPLESGGAVKAAGDLAGAVGYVAPYLTPTIPFPR